MSIYSATAQIAAMLGGYLYEWVFDRQVVPLIYLAALCTLTALAWIPFVATMSDPVRAATPDQSGQEALKGLPA
jgi:cyanate permease